MTGTERMEPLPALFVTVMSIGIGLLVGGIPGAVIAPILGLALYSMTLSEIAENEGE
ncbi:hypothetical protein [Haladaptatus salinisoli]|uniref:hypothetical protein n=1 Tax=Haladaptatus salinisoli TaxID=2884876 RepID=UPI001D0A3CAB|nr:hypothetical protein [Haladaptatus salinisoli]